MNEKAKTEFQRCNRRLPFTSAPQHLPPSGPNSSVTIGRFGRAWCLIFGISLPGCSHGFALRWL